MQLGIKRLNIVGDSKLVVQQARVFVTASIPQAAVRRFDGDSAVLRVQSAAVSMTTAG